jgi:hypothetical protein
MIQPPNTSPAGLVSAGSGMTRRARCSVEGLASAGIGRSAMFVPSRSLSIVDKGIKGA